MRGWTRGWHMIEKAEKAERAERAEQLTLSPFARRVTAAFALSAFSAFSAPALRAQSSTSPLAFRLDARLDSPPFDRQLWGVALVDEKGALLFGRNQRQLFVPASNNKIVVAAVASALLPPDWTVRTSLYADGPVAGGVV